MSSNSNCRMLSAIFKFFIITLLLQGCGTKVDCNDSKTKNTALEIIHSHLISAVWYREMSAALSSPELKNIKTTFRNDELKQCQCSGTYSFTYNGKQREIDVAYELAYLQDKGETEVKVDVNSVKAGLMAIAMREPVETLDPELPTKHRNLTPLSTVRYTQYGFLPNDEDHLQAVFGLEEILLKTISYNGGVAVLNENMVQAAEVTGGFKVHRQNHVELANFLNWWNKRFKPVYLAHLTALNRVAPGKNLDDVDGLSQDEKVKYLDLATFSDGPYTELVSPFPGMDSLAAGPIDVTRAIEMVNKTLPISDSALPK